MKHRSTKNMDDLRDKLNEIAEAIRSREAASYE